jgi:hypothetical protein
LVAICLFSDRPKTRITTALVLEKGDKAAVTISTSKGILSRRRFSVEEETTEY